MNIVVLPQKGQDAARGTDCVQGWLCAPDIWEMLECKEKEELPKERGKFTLQLQAAAQTCRVWDCWERSWERIL